MRSKLVAFLLILALLLCGCGSKAADPAGTLAPAPTPPAQPTPAGLGLDEDIVVLYTNDIHCAIDQNLGFAGLSTVKSTLELQGKHVLLADAGDAVQGDTVGTLSSGGYIIDIMNELGYAVATPGNHDFDFGMAQFQENVDYADFPFISCNFVDKEGKTVLDPYKIIDVAGVKLGFVGITTPRTLTSSAPKYFQNDRGRYIYGFLQDETGEGVYAAVQSAVDAARADGAQFVIALAHLGIELDCSPWTSSEVIENTSGIDVMLDGHSHSVLEKELVRNKAGKEVILSSTGTKLENIGCLTIKDDGSLDTKLINDRGMEEFIDGIKAEYEELSSTVVAHTDVELTIIDPETGERMIRQNETNLGDLVADAYLAAAGADIAFANGGGIRESIPAGDISYGQIIAVQPFCNSICMVEATGQEILDALEFGVSKTPNEFGGFMQVSGIEFVIDMSVSSPVQRNTDGTFASLSGDRRISSVKVGGADLDPAKTYTLASTDYTLRSMGDGYNMFADNVFLKDNIMLDNQALIDYIVQQLDGVVGEEYSQPYGQGRIVYKVPGAE